MKFIVAPYTISAPTFARRRRIESNPATHYRNTKRNGDRHCKVCVAFSPVAFECLHHCVSCTLWH